MEKNNIDDVKKTCETDHNDKSNNFKKELKKIIPILLVVSTFFLGIVLGVFVKKNEDSLKLNLNLEGKNVVNKLDDYRFIKKESNEVFKMYDVFSIENGSIYTLIHDRNISQFKIKGNPYWNVLDQSKDCKRGFSFMAMEIEYKYSGCDFLEAIKKELNAMVIREAVEKKLQKDLDLIDLMKKDLNKVMNEQKKTRNKNIESSQLELDNSQNIVIENINADEKEIMDQFLESEKLTTNKKSGAGVGKLVEKNPKYLNNIAALFSANSMSLGGEGDGKVLFVFYAPDCPNCIETDRKIKVAIKDFGVQLIYIPVRKSDNYQPAIDFLQNKYPNAIVTKEHIQSNDVLFDLFSKSHGIKGVPSFVYFKDGYLEVKEGVSSSGIPTLLRNVGEIPGA